MTSKARLLARFNKDEEWLIEEIDKIAKKEFSSRSTIVKQAIAGYIFGYKKLEWGSRKTAKKESGDLT